MHKLSFFGIKATSPELACNKVNERKNRTTTIEELLKEVKKQFPNMTDKDIAEMTEGWYDDVPEHDIIGCLSEDDEGYIYSDDKYIRWNPKEWTIEDLNTIFREKIEGFDILKDEFLDEDGDEDYELVQLSSTEEEGKFYIVFADSKIY